MDDTASSFRDEDDSLLLLPTVPELTQSEAEEMGFDWASTEGILEFEAVPFSERKSSVFAVLNKWVNDGFVSSYVTLAMMREVDHFLTSICPPNGEKFQVTHTSEDYGRNMLKVLSLLVSTGEYPQNDDKLDWLFDVLSEVLRAEAIRESGDPAIPVALETVGDVRRLIGVIIYVADVLQENTIDNPYISVSEENGMWISNPEVSGYILEHPESAHAIARHMMDRRIGSTVEEGLYVIQWHEDIASSLKSGSL